MKIDKDTVVLITGGAQGLGFAIKYLASKGAKIFIVDIDENKLRKVYGCLFNPASRLDLSWCLCDVSIPEQVEAALTNVLQNLVKLML